ncbi:MAG: hypothetical protein VR70_08855 [Rhodospirillaceae bacterium BRH_c57]|nr:MAG: hypothetical protein VR70_08855 [Rhodospirillaceae bacterium BRH_c57]
MKSLGKALLVGAGMLWASVAVAGEQDFTLVNATGYQIDYVYVASSNSNDWEDDVMGQDALADGEAVDIEFSGGTRGCKFDLKAIYNDKEEAVWTGFDLCSVSKITLHYNSNTGATTAVYE